VAARSGVYTPWREWEGDDLPLGGDVVYVRDGALVGSRDLLVEAIRTDGLSANLGDAYRMLDNVTFHPGFYGFLEGNIIPVLCDDDGMTDDGDQVETATPCVFASIGATG
jgi:hypothetical protein